MSYNWTSAATPQGRERLKELLDSGKGVIVSTWPMNFHVITLNEGKYNILDRGAFDSFDAMIDSLKGPQFLDPSPSPEPVADENGLLPCPFCGGKAITEFLAVEGASEKIHSAFCDDDDCIGSHCMWADMPSKEGAIAAWNRRSGKEANP